MRVSVQTLGNDVDSQLVTAISVRRESRARL